MYGAVYALPTSTSYSLRTTPKKEVDSDERNVTFIGVARFGCGSAPEDAALRGATP